MTFIHFLIDNPVVAFLLLLVLLVTIAPLASGWLSRKKSAHSHVAFEAMKEAKTPRLLGIQLDLAILVLGIFLLLALVGWIRKAFLG